MYNIPLSRRSGVIEGSFQLRTIIAKLPRGLALSKNSLEMTRGGEGGGDVDDDSIRFASDDGGEGGDGVLFG